MNCSNTLDPYPQGRMKERESQPGDAQITRSLEWELLLPPVEDLTPINQSLITPGIASALGITPTKCSTLFVTEPGSEFELLKLFPEKSDSEGCRVRKRADSEDAGGGSDEWNSGGDESGSSSRATKRPRLVWTPELHQRFVDVIGELGVDKAVPKTIMEMMNVDGLTRENVASHLQKYRLYLKKAEGITPEMNSNSNPISISSTSSGGRSASTLECGNSVFGSILPFNSMAMNMMSLPLPSMLGGLGAGSLSFGYDSYEGEHMGLGLAPDGSRKPAYCAMDSVGFNSSLFWNRHGG